MIVRHSKLLLEQLSELEERIQKVEKYMEQLGIEVDREVLLAALLTGARGSKSTCAGEKH